MTKSIIICGVGGQGIILASDILANVFFSKGFDVKKNEIHGMSQREGAVISFLKFGEKVYSPVVSYGEADYLISFENLETIRNLHYLKENGYIIANDFKKEPIPVKLGIEKYPDNIVELIEKITKNYKHFNAESIAKKVKNPKATNIVLLGAFSVYFDIEKEYFIESIKSYSKPEFLESNIEAFLEGRKI